MSWSNFISKLAGKVDEKNGAWRFRTSIMCNGCIAKITPILDAAQGIASWHVALDTPDRVLTVVPDGIDENQLVKLVREAGFTIERIR